MCKKNNLEEINVGKINTSKIDAMSIGTDTFKLYHEYNCIEIGKYKGVTKTIEIDGHKLTFIGGILVEEDN